MQSSKEKEQTLHKFKSFFRMTSKQGGNVHLFLIKCWFLALIYRCFFLSFTHSYVGTRDRHEFCLTPELEKEVSNEIRFLLDLSMKISVFFLFQLRPETPVAQRCKTLKDLGDIVANNALKEVCCVFLKMGSHLNFTRFRFLLLEPRTETVGSHKGLDCAQ